MEEEKPTHLEVASTEAGDTTTVSEEEDDRNEVQENDVKTNAERNLVWKQDLLILPLLAISTFFGYLDRGQIGNARVMGMQRDLDLTNQEWYNCIVMFFLGYGAIELPAGLLLRYWSPRYLFAGGLVTFGLGATCIAVARSYAAIIILRVIIGLGEVFVTNSYIYLSLWYKPAELSMRVALMYCTTPIAGAFSGLIAYGTARNLEGAHGKASWQWLFIIEGAATLGFSFVVLTLLPGLPEVVAKNGSLLFRHPSERQLIHERLVAGQNMQNVRARPHQILLAFRDPKLYLGAAMLGAQGIGIGAFSIILPTLINEFGFSALETQLYSMIPYAFGFFSMIAIPYIADRMHRKGVTTVACLCITCIGFILLLSTTNKPALLAGTCFVATGAYPGLAVSAAWFLTFHGGYTKRATAVWISQIFVQAYSIISTQVYRTPPRFFLGHAVSLGLYGLAIACSLILLNMLTRANKSKDLIQMEYEATGERNPQMEVDFEEMGDFHPSYRYAL